MNTLTHCYVGSMRCGCGVAIVMDEPDYPKDTAKSVADMVKSGYVVQRYERDAGVAVFQQHCENYPHEAWQIKFEDARQRNKAKAMA